MEHPESLLNLEKFLTSVDSKQSVIGIGIRTHMGKLLRKKAITNFMNGGLIRQSLDMFDEYKNVDESVKTETFLFSLSVFFLFIR